MLLGLLLFQSTGLFTVHQLQLSYVRREMKQKIKAGIPEEDLVLLAIPKSLEKNPNDEFTRIHEREFRYHGEMYDIISQYSNADTTFYKCIHDVKESGIFARLDDLVKDQLNGDPVQKHQREMFLGFFHKVYLIASAEIAMTDASARKNKTIYSYSVIEGFVKKMSQPPEIKA